MNSIAYIKQHILSLVQNKFNISEKDSKSLALTFNQNPKFGDFSLNAAFVIATMNNTTPQEEAVKVAELLQSKVIGSQNKLSSHIDSVEVMSNGFININLTQATWKTTAHELIVHPETCFKLFDDEARHSYLVEFVSANPTGPLSIAHGRNAIIGDVLGRVLKFLGHKVTKEFYINDAGNQIQQLGLSLKNKVNCLLNLPQDFCSQTQYDNEYIFALAEQMSKEMGFELEKKSVDFFSTYAKNHFLSQIKQDLDGYGVSFDSWISEEAFHKSGQVKECLQLLAAKGLTYELDGAVWFKSQEFGDDKDFVLVKGDGSLTYAAPDIAYHRDKFNRGYDFIIDILGQDHHGYEKRLRAVVKALGYLPEKFKVVLYQLVMIKKEDQVIRMSKRLGTFKSLADIVQLVGVDVARYFYLNKKADSHLNFDLELATKNTDENPVFYIQYAYVRTFGIISKALEVESLKEFVEKILKKTINEALVEDINYNFSRNEIELLKKVCSLRHVLMTIAATYQTHLLANFVFELAQSFHAYYNTNKIVDADSAGNSMGRLVLVVIIRNSLRLSLDLLGLSKPDRM